MHPQKNVWWPAELLDPFDLPRGRQLPEGCLQGVWGCCVGVLYVVWCVWCGVCGVVCVVWCGVCSMWCGVSLAQRM